MDFDQVADELYSADPEDFTALRKQRAGEARAAGDRELAKKITALRRPTRSAWIVNLLPGQAGEEMKGLLELGAALADAQQRLSGDDLRRLSAQRHAAIASLVKRGCQLADIRGHTATEATRREVADTLQAALSDPQVAEQVRAGRLSTAQEYGGFGPELLFGAMTPAPTPTTGDHERGDQPPPATEDDHDDDRAADHDAGDQETGDHDPEREQQRQRDAEHERLVQQLNTSQQALDRIRSQAKRLGEQLESAEETATRRAERVRELEDQLDRARSAAEKADAEVDRLRSSLEQSESAEQAAEQAVSDALSRLADS